MGDLTLVRIGTETDGDPARVCPHMAQWWPLYTQLLKLKLGITLEIIQAAGSYSKSGATHVEGTAIDWRTWRFRDSVVDDAVELAREGGAPATWMRSKRRFGQPFDDHVHSALDCPCKSGADYQIAAVKAGYNGLGPRGRGGGDYHRKPSAWRNWADGMAWMRSEIARLDPTTTQTIQEDDMPLTNEDLDKIASRVWSATWGAETAGERLGKAARQTELIGSQVLGTLLGRSGPHVGTAIQSTYQTVSALAAREGIEVDESAIAAEVVALLAPTIREIVEAEVREGGTPEAIAEAVVDRMGAALTQA